MSCGRRLGQLLDAQRESCPVLFARFDLAHPELADFQPVQRIVGEDLERGRRGNRLWSRWHESGHGLTASHEPGHRSDHQQATMIHKT